MFIDKVTIRRPSCLVKGMINSSELKLIEDALLIAVNTFLNNANPNTPFCLSDLVGNNNMPWLEPFSLIHNKYVEAGYDYHYAFVLSGRDMGWILKNILNSDTTKIYAVPNRMYRNGKQVLHYRKI